MFYTNNKLIQIIVTYLGIIKMSYEKEKEKVKKKGIFFILKERERERRCFWSVTILRFTAGFPS